MYNNSICIFIIFLLIVQNGNDFIFGTFGSGNGVLARISIRRIFKKALFCEPGYSIFTPPNERKNNAATYRPHNKPYQPRPDDDDLPPARPVRPHGSSPQRHDLPYRPRPDQTHDHGGKPRPHIPSDEFAPIIPPNNQERFVLLTEEVGYDNVGTIYVTEFLTSYDNERRIPHYVQEMLSPINNKNGAKRLDNFFKDERIPDIFQSNTHDYDGTDFDRGHLANARNYAYNQTKQDETFVMSNMAPQTAALNRGIWKTLEARANDWAGEYGKVYICSGPLFLPQREENKNYVKYQVIGRNNVAVPTHFFKVILIQKTMSDSRRIWEMHSHMFSNDPKVYNTKDDETTDVKLKRSYVKREEVERLAGFKIFPKIKDDDIYNINTESTSNGDRRRGSHSPRSYPNGNVGRRSHSPRSPHNGDARRGNYSPGSPYNGDASRASRGPRTPSFSNGESSHRQRSSSNAAYGHQDRRFG